jgi:hypothetical protein
VSNSTAQPIIVTMAEVPGDQTVTIWPAAQTQQTPVIGTTMVGDDQTVEITPSGAQ